MTSLALSMRARSVHSTRVGPLLYCTLNSYLSSSLPPRIVSSCSATHAPSGLSRRPFTTSSSSKVPAHDVLGLSLSESRDYKTVKSAFLLLAKRTHPDTASSSPPYPYTFGQVRSAFEYLLSTPSLKSSSSGEAGVILSEFDNWFSEATAAAGGSASSSGGGGALHAFRADEATLRELADAGENLARGGLDKGGMWALADMIAAREKEERERNGF
jgi:hypothetical protein